MILNILISSEKENDLAFIFFEKLFLEYPDTCARYVLLESFNILYITFSFSAAIINLFNTDFADNDLLFTGFILQQQYIQQIRSTH